MAVDLETTHEPSVTELVTGIIADGQKLFKQQVEMLTHEIKEDVAKTRQAGLLLGFGVGVGLVGAVLLAMMLVLLTNWALPDLPLWSCYGIWGAIVFILGAGLAYKGHLKLDGFNPLKDESAQTMKENVAWITNPK